MALTAAACKNAKPKDKTFRLYDEKGLYLEVTKAGGRYWRMKYRVAGKEKRLALGVYPDVSLSEARSKRDEARKLHQQGIDPGQHKKTERLKQIQNSEHTLKAVSARWLELKSKDWTDGHTKTVRERLNNYILPWLGDLPITEITTPQVIQVLNRLLERNIDESARRVATIIKQIFKYSSSVGITQPYQIGDLSEVLPAKKVKHLASVTDPKRLGEILQAIYGYNGSLPVCYAMRVSPMLFSRPGNIRFMKWAHLDLDNAEWLIPGDELKGRKTQKASRDPLLVPLPHQAVTLLRDLHPLTGHKTYVFSCRPDGKPISENTITQALRRLDIGKEEMCPHGFRATARTIGEEVLGFRPDLLEHQLAHSVRDPNGRAYNRTKFINERCAMMQAWADYLDNLREGQSMP